MICEKMQSKKRGNTMSGASEIIVKQNHHFVNERSRNFRRRSKPRRPISRPGSRWDSYTGSLERLTGSMGRHQSRLVQRIRASTLG